MLIDKRTSPRNSQAIRQITVIPRSSITRNGQLIGYLNLNQIGRSLSSVGLFLFSGGLSTSLTVTYEAGFVRDINAMAQTVTWVTPRDGGDVPDLAAVNLAAQSNWDGAVTAKHASVLLAGAQNYRFKVKENNIAADTIELYAALLTQDFA